MNILSEFRKSFSSDHLAFAASIKPHTTNAKQLTPGTRNNIFQYGVERIEDIIAIVASNATLAAAINKLRLTVSRESAKSNTLIAMISKPSWRHMWSEYVVTALIPVSV